MLRSSSTPLLGSLIPSFSDSPNNNNSNNNNNHHHSDLHSSTPKHTPNSIHSKISCTNGGGGGGSHSFRRSMFSHSPSLADQIKSATGFRRVQSEGNLDELLSNGSYNTDEFSLIKKPSRRTSCTLEAIPSFSTHHLETSYEYDDDSDNDDQDDDEESELEDIVDDHKYPFEVESLVSQHVTRNVNDYGGLRYGDEGKMYIASGLGISGVSFIDGGTIGGGGGGGGGGGSYKAVAFDKDGGDISMEEHYKKMMEGNPGNALFLRNYAQFLYQKKRDLKGAEEYYSRAILADPQDGEILSQYAKLVWELHRDKERAASYFERAVQASSEDSNIHAAYANFLWDTEEDNDEDEENAAPNFLVGFRHGFMASTTA